MVKMLAMPPQGCASVSCWTSHTKMGRILVIKGVPRRQAQGASPAPLHNPSAMPSLRHAPSRTSICLCDNPKARVSMKHGFFLTKYNPNLHLFFTTKLEHNLI